MSLECDLASRYATTGTTKVIIDRVYHMVMDNRQMTIDQIANSTSISCERVENILHNELGMTNVFIQVGCVTTSTDTRSKG